MKHLVKQARAKTFAALLVAGLIPVASQAEPMSKEKGITMGTGAVVGAVVGGPFGFAVGTIAGGVLGDSADKSTELKNQELAMNDAAQEIEFLEKQIVDLDLVTEDMESEITQLEDALLTRLEFQVLFRTGDDRLRDQDRERIAMLAKYMRRNTDVSVRLEGHTDVRGTDEYNAILAEYRARAVADALIARGISGDRVQIESFGASKATATPGDYEGYALDRHVNIEVISKKQLAEEGEDTAAKLALAE